MAHRTFRDRLGGSWIVWEVLPSFAERRATPPGNPVPRDRRKVQAPRASLPTEMRYGWLAFEGKVERRRLAPTPDGWELMTDDELVGLLERAVSTGRVKRLIE